MKLATEYQWTLLKPSEYGGRFKYRVHKVPVFTVHEREHGGQVHKIDKDRLFKIAANINKLHEVNNWMPAIHEEHHNRMFDKASRPRLGMMVNPVIENAQIADYDASNRLITKTKPVLFIDWLIENDEQLDKLPLLPYRSVEVDLKKNVLGSVACIQSRETFFKFPLFNHAKKSGGYSVAYEAVDYDAAEDTQTIDSLVGLAVSGSECMALYHFPKIQYSEGFEPMEEEEEKDEAPPVDEGEEKEPKAKDEDEEKGDGGLADRVKDLIASEFEPMRQQFNEFMEGCKSTMGSSYLEDPKMNEELEEEPVVMANNDDSDVADYIADIVRSVIREEQSAQYAAMDGKLSGALSRIDEHNRISGMDNALLWARKQTSRVVTPPDFEDKVLGYAADNYDIDDEGSALVAYVSAIASTSIDLPGEQFYNAPEVMNNDPEEVAEYAGDAQAIGKARRMNAHFDVLAKATPGLAAALGHGGRKKYISRGIQTVPTGN